MAVCSPATEFAFHPWKAIGSIRQAGKDARHIGMRVHDRAACCRQPLHDIVVKAGEEARCAPAEERKHL